MKKAFIAGLITLFSLLCAHASEILLTEAKIWQIRASIEAQAEQIKRAQEIIENRTSVSKARIEEQLRIAEEDLIIQREKLEIFETNSPTNSRNWSGWPMSSRRTGGASLTTLWTRYGPRYLRTTASSDDYGCSRRERVLAMT